MIMRRVVIAVVAMSLAILSVTATEAETIQPQKSVETTETKAQEPSVAGLRANVTALTARLIQEYVTPTLCSYSPEFCAKHQLQTSRAIQSYLATAGTMFAGALGVIFMKIKILLVLSLMTTIMGKMLLFYIFAKPHPHHHFGHYLHGYHHKTPFVKYTRDKYYIKNSPVEHSHDLIVDQPAHHPYHGHDDYHHHRQSASVSGGVSYYKRR